MRLHLQSCLHHSEREAAARCPVCRQYFCRECITEHDDQVICAACLKKTIQRETTSRRNFSSLNLGMGWILSVGVAWATFYSIGRILLAIPTTFHDGSLWQTYLRP